MPSDVIFAASRQPRPSLKTSPGSRCRLDEQHVDHLDGRRCVSLFVFIYNASLSSTQSLSGGEEVEFRAVEDPAGCVRAPWAREYSSDVDGVDGRDAAAVCARVEGIVDRYVLVPCETVRRSSSRRRSSTSNWPE